MTALLEPTVHPVRLSPRERRGLKRQKEELQRSTLLTRPDPYIRPIACITTCADVGHSTFECLEPQLQEQENGDLKYILICPTAGLFKCKFTSLMFKMEKAGKVEYHSVPWENKLENLGCEPAGPLYNINCIPGTPVQIHLPHCEVISDGKLKHLCVAHITGDDLEVISPKEITESHVVINITGLSGFGLTSSSRGRNIRAMVLLFLQTSSRPELQVLLLSSNTDIRMVKRRRNKMIQPQTEIFIERNPDCIINTHRYYSLFTDPPELIVTPDRAQYVECNPNFSPAFTVLCSTEKELNLILKGGKKELWNRVVNIEEKGTPDERQHGAEPDFSESTALPMELSSRERRGLKRRLNGQKATSKGRQHVSEPSVSKDFFQKHKGALEARLPTVLGPILKKLVEMKVLSTTEREAIESKTPDNKRNEFLLRILDKRGTKAQEIFYQVLQTEDSHLVEDLEKNN